VLKSTSFPPYDPWYAGGYLNYYYFGFVFVGVLTKWLGIVPSFAYNLILPTIFSLIAMGAFSIAWNLAAHAQAKSPPDPVEPSQGIKTNIPSSKFIPAIAAAMGMALLGNLGTVRMIFQGFQKIVAPDGIIEGGNIFIHYWWALRGFIRTLQGAHLPYSIGDWYWIPSRAIPAPGDVEPITEFPYFTALYGDPHAHLFAMPIALLALAGILGIMLSLTRKRSGLGTSLAFIIVGLAVGALKPTNTWDFYPYLVLGIVAVGYSFWRGFHPSPGFAERFPLLAEIPTPVLRVLWPLAGIGLFIICSTLPFLPFDHWYALGYSKVDLWKGTHTSLNAYLTHWGLFLFVIISWMLAETVEWMAATPLSALRKLRPYWELILSILIIFLFAILGLLYLHVRIAWFVVPLMAWAGVLLLRPGLSDAKRAVLFLVGTGLALTLTVEIVVLRGDIGRMNTVFKFYLQVWTLFAVSAAAGLGWLAGVFYSGKSRPPVWSFGWRVAWQSLLALLVAGTSLYTFTATLAKIKDRMADQAPHTLDGMTYMQYATYQDQWGTMDLSQDYQAIRWLQENVSGSPVIVEANLRDLYRWGSRISIYTGLPGVVGWEWHQQQQRAVVPGDWISSRIDEIADFYQTTDWKAAEAFLQKYDVKYIVLGQQERGKYPGEGLDKFLQAEGILWQEVYHQGDTIIFQVLNSTED
jgi:YYY domain-containing protein